MIEGSDACGQAQWDDHLHPGQEGPPGQALVLYLTLQLYRTLVQYSTLMYSMYSMNCSPFVEMWKINGMVTHCLNFLMLMGEPLSALCLAWEVHYMPIWELPKSPDLRKKFCFAFSRNFHKIFFCVSLI